MKVECKDCGFVQEYDPAYPYCRHCGAALIQEEARTSSNSFIKYKAAGLFMMVIFFFLFLFASRYYGAAGILVGVLLWLWGEEKKRQLRKPR